ncbi:ferroptosis suppressor protein 1-like [Carcharodon carcharias]|uniref:ferroptosis suppressor protein 1-like n=1 Tax=Carcharodon carcharias TaxID=13397 RepID=UPI001B7F4C3E|nr:ferroptosis suppressor protein 1-like [Carcharodon carcharias]XP_041032007.1 ferroptosis suppressor protein 1-like [Carcharodon carcharias]
MGGAASVDQSVHVVIVGGGFGGIAAGNQLKSYSVPFTLIDIKDAFHHNPGALRASVESGFAKKTFISFAKTFAENFRQGKVVDIDLEKQDVILESGEIVHFSHLILATGSSGPFPGKFAEPVTMENAIQIYEDLVKKVQEAQRVVVIGGGSAGVEMAAEIKTDYPDKEVTLIHSKIALADVQLLPSVRQGLKDILLKKGVQLQLGQKVINLQDLVVNEMQDNIKVVTDKGLEIITDMVICCTGIRINSSAYSNAFKDWLAEDGALLVNEHLQVNGLENVYAIGDCAHVKEPKMAYHAGLHGVVAADNIVNSLGKKCLKVYKPGSLTMLLSMGRNDGIGQLYGWHVGKFIVVMAKSKDLLVWKSWKEMGQTAPSDDLSA